MKNFKRFRTWVTVVAAVCWSYMQQRTGAAESGAGAAGRGRESADEPRSAKPVVEVLNDDAAAIDSSIPNGTYQPGSMNDQTAQRLARLLISEIKLYYMNKLDGQDTSEMRNIYDLLKGPIDKSRQHYRQRVGAQAIETMPDYFHGELVRSLCAGDASRLGPNYRTTR